jgi:vacuolar-type H+-ATPase subunit B/Vma2
MSEGGQMSSVNEESMNTSDQDFMMYGNKFEDELYDQAIKKNTNDASETMRSLPII